MVQWRRLFGAEGNQDRHRWRDDARHLLPTFHDEDIVSAIPAKDVTKVALRLKYLIEEVIPCELKESHITTPHGKIITKAVIKAAHAAGGKDHGACVVYCLLVNKRWFKKQALLELWDADLHELRATACEVIAKEIIEREDDQNYLFQNILLKRYAICVEGGETQATNVIERAVDLHSLLVSGSSGYQKCVNYLWRGWLIQDEQDPSSFIDFKEKSNTSYWAHFHPDRMRAPIYQNATQVIISIIYLGLYTGAINTVNPTGDLDAAEVLLYFFTFGFLADEFAKFWKVGRNYLGFWNAFNLVLYALLTTSLITRIMALSHPIEHHVHGPRGRLNRLSYNFLAFSAPMFWMRLMLYLDSVQFFGAMIVVLKVMMKESLIFFSLLIVIIIGFLQAFIGMDNADANVEATTFILQAMANAIMQSPDFDGFERFAPPFGIILYYLFTFVVMVILLNVLIALYNSAYEDITGNAVDEYMALFAQKTMQFVRAPDENVFIAPFNLIELFCLVIPFEWWMSDKNYSKLNDIVMGILYSPLLVVAAYWETRSAKKVNFNRRHGEEDDDTVEEWEHMAGEVDFEGEGWDKRCSLVSPNLEEEPAEVLCKQLQVEVKELKGLILQLLGDKGTGNGHGKGKETEDLIQIEGGAADEGEASDDKPTWSEVAANGS